MSGFDSCPSGASGDAGGLEIPADPKLVAEGWVRRFLADPVRVGETVELYTSLGYEVKVEKFTPTDFSRECHACAEEVCKSYVLIYTRKISRS